MPSEGLVFIMKPGKMVLKLRWGSPDTGTNINQTFWSATGNTLEKTLTLASKRPLRLIELLSESFSSVMPREPLHVQKLNLCSHSALITKSSPQGPPKVWVQISSLSFGLTFTL